jgi:hypothetical protein
MYNGSPIPSLPHLLYSLSITDPTNPNYRIIDKEGLEIIKEEIYLQHPNADHVWLL